MGRHSKEEVYKGGGFLTKGECKRVGGLLKQETPEWELIGERNYKKRGRFRSLFLEKETHYNGTFWRRRRTSEGIY